MPDWALHTFQLLAHQIFIIFSLDYFSRYGKCSWPHVSRGFIKRSLTKNSCLHLASWTVAQGEWLCSRSEIWVKVMVSSDLCQGDEEDWQEDNTKTLGWLWRKINIIKRRIISALYCYADLSPICSSLNTFKRPVFGNFFKEQFLVLLSFPGRWWGPLSPSSSVPDLNRPQFISVN